MVTQQILQHPDMPETSLDIHRAIGLPTRPAFVQQHGRTLQQHAKEARVFCLLCIDLDGLPTIKAELGAVLTDGLLEVVGQRLAHATRNGDVLCRLDEEEFVCLLTDLNGTAQARLRVDKIVAAVSEPWRVGQRTVQIGTHIGTAIYPRDGHSLPALLAHADKAMRGAQSQKLALRQRAATTARARQA